MAAANVLRLVPASFGKRLACQIQSPFTLRKLHNSLYDKNPEESSHSAVVPDHVMPPPQNEEYWVPHPTTGVFGPATDHDKQRDSGVQLPNANSVLEEKAFFRPLEDLEKPPVQP